MRPYPSGTQTTKKITTADFQPGIRNRGSINSKKYYYRTLLFGLPFVYATEFEYWLFLEVRVIYLLSIWVFDKDKIGTSSEAAMLNNLTTLALWMWNGASVV
jgi:hypothetical protein